MGDPKSIGPAMAVALLTTLYGAFVANVMFMPMVGKLEYYTAYEVVYREMVLEGLRGIARSESPRNIQDQMASSLPPKLQSKFDKSKFEVIAINLDRGPKAKAQSFFKDNDIKNISLYFDSKNNIPREIKALGLPATILINQDGKQIAKYLGPADWEDQYFVDLFSKYIN